MESEEDEREGGRKAEVIHHGYLESTDHSYASEEDEGEEEEDDGEEEDEDEEEEEEGEEAGGKEEQYSDAALAFQAAPSLGFFRSFLDSTAPSFPARSPPPPDVRISVMNSSIEQPAFSGAKGKESFLSLSSLYDVSGNGRIPKAGHLKVVDAVLRSLAAVFSLIVFCVMSSTRELRVAAGSTFEVKFSDFQAYNYLVAVNVLAFAYSSAQVVLVLQSGSRSSSKGSVFASPIRAGICKYFCDEILAFCLFSASSSAATASTLSHQGLQNIWPPACSTWKLWMLCSKADAAVTISFFSSFCVILSSLVSGLYLLQLMVVA